MPSTTSRGSQPSTTLNNVEHLDDNDDDESVAENFRTSAATFGDISTRATVGVEVGPTFLFDKTSSSEMTSFPGQETGRESPNLPFNLTSVLQEKQ